eukprot:SAG31_NODE_36441_length_313_cov_0.957944_1_plen_51_part_01
MPDLAISGYLAWTMAQMSVFLMNHHLLRTHTGVCKSECRHNEAGIRFVAFA